MTLLFFPILVEAYDYGFVIPALGPLFAAAALAAWGLGLRIKGGSAVVSGPRSRNPAARDA